MPHRSGLLPDPKTPRTHEEQPRSERTSRPQKPSDGSRERIRHPPPSRHRFAHRRQLRSAVWTKPRTAGNASPPHSPPCGGTLAARCLLDRSGAPESACIRKNRKPDDDESKRNRSAPSAPSVRRKRGSGVRGSGKKRTFAAWNPHPSVFVRHNAKTRPAFWKSSVRPRRR